MTAGSMKTAFHCGFAIGSANLLWLYAAYYLGLHTSGIEIFQVFMLGWLVITIGGHVIALRTIRQQENGLSWVDGVRAGAVAATASAIVAVIAQVGYYNVVHPEWPDYMLNQTREHFAAQDLSAEEMEQRLEQARSYFSLQSYTVQSAMAAFIMGTLISAVAMIFLRSTTGSNEAEISQPTSEPGSSDDEPNASDASPASLPD